MAKVALFTDKITQRETKTLTRVTSVNVSNYGDEKAEIYVNGHKRLIPPVDDTYGIPQGDFYMNSNGHHFDVQIDFRQNNTNLILDYQQLIEERADKC
jgi:hypothetical protein